jgi:hypothetical protein
MSRGLGVGVVDCIIPSHHHYTYLYIASASRLGQTLSAYATCKHLESLISSVQSTLTTYQPTPPTLIPHGSPPPPPPVQSANNDRPSFTLVDIEHRPYGKLPPELIRVRLTEIAQSLCLGAVNGVLVRFVFTGYIAYWR